MSDSVYFKRLFTYRRVLFAVLFVWSATIGGFAWWYSAESAANLSEMARLYARACHEKDVMYRRWNATHGGVYVPVTKDNPPNPYLQVAEREVTTPSGRTLTLVNPAYMVRQVHELAANSGSVQTHITSLKPLNPDNTPDKWEQKALFAFEEGEKEASVVVHQNGKHTARLIQPLYVEQSCLKCHEQQGYKIGDVRGGISVTVPIDSIWNAEIQQARNVSIALGAIWLLGTMAIILVGKFINMRHLERRQAVDALDKKQEFLNAILDNIRDGIVACNAEGVLTLFNPATRQFHGLPEEPIPAEEWPKHFDLYLADGTTPMKKEDVPLYRALQGETVRNVEMVIAPKNDKLVRLLADGKQLVVGGKLVGAVVVMHDITEQTEAERILRESEERYRSLVENIDLGITLVDQNHRVVMVNEKVAALIGRSSAEFAGEECFRVFEKRETVCPHCPGVQAMSTGRPAEVETAGVRDDGSTYAARNQAFPLRGSHGNSMGFIEVVEDITNRKQTEQELRDAKLAAEAASRAKSEFLANMSHEIRTPMTAILGFADILAGNPTHEEVVEAIEIIRSNGTNLLRIIDDILDLSKIEAGRHDVERIACSPNKIAAEVISLMKASANAKKLPLTLDIWGDTPQQIFTDPTRLRQILVNLIGNAIKFTEVGGVRVFMRANTTLEGESAIRIDVIDTGIGISEEQIPLLFQPFSQVDASARRRFGGTGLGLAISMRLAKMLDGDIEVQSIPELGSKFSLIIGIGPVDEPAVHPESLAITDHSDRSLLANDRQPIAADTPTKLNCRILLVEDNPSNQLMITFLLRKAGAEVTVAENGRFAVELALTAQKSENCFDLILMDMQMPVMDGYEATRKLRASGYTKPILALTAHAMTGDRQKCLVAGCDDYMRKPIKQEILFELLEMWVTRGQCMAKSVEATP
jgi:PAS domain S-box-containing protein